MVFEYFGLNFRKITVLLTTFALLTVELYFAYQVKGINGLYKKFSKKNRIIDNTFFVLVGKRFVCIAGESVCQSLHTLMIWSIVLQLC